MGGAGVKRFWLQRLRGGDSDGPMTAPPDFQPAVSVALVRGDKVLLVTRGRAPSKDFLAFPGGRVEAGESLVEAARRELAEETGLGAGELTQVDVLEIVGAPGEASFRLHVFSGAYVGGEAVAADDAADAGWYSLADMNGRPVLVSVVNVARRLLGTKYAP